MKPFSVTVALCLCCLTSLVQAAEVGKGTFHVAGYGGGGYVVFDEPGNVVILHVGINAFGFGELSGQRNVAAPQCYDGIIETKAFSLAGIVGNINYRVDACTSGISMRKRISQNLHIVSWMAKSTGRCG